MSAAADKGAELEVAFAEWLRSQGYAEIRTGQGGRFVRGSAKLSAAYQVDVSAEERRPFWTLVALFGVFLPFLVMGMTYDIPWAATWWKPPLFLGAMLAMQLLVPLGKLLRHDRVWVECKNRAEKISRDDVLKLRAATHEVSAGPDGWAPTTIMLVSGSDFTRDALERNPSAIGVVPLG